jgi:hypothetical protein
MVYDLQETIDSLQAGDLPADIMPHLVWNEMIMGAQKRRVFLEGTEQTDMLRGAIGTKISVPILSTRFTATTISESSLDSSGYTFTNPAVTDTDISIGNQVYVAFAITDILREDSPNYDWIRILLRDAGRAIEEYRDSAVRDVLIAGVGNTVNAATYGTLAYGDITNLLTQMKEDSWYPEESSPLLFLYPDQENDLINATTFVDGAYRYGVSGADTLVGAEKNPADRTIAGLRVRVSENMKPALALIVMTNVPGSQNGPIAIHAIKRPLTIRSQREEIYGRQLWVASIRYGSAVIQANAIGLISRC